MRSPPSHQTASHASTNRRTPPLNLNCAHHLAQPLLALPQPPQPYYAYPAAAYASPPPLPPPPLVLIPASSICASALAVVQAPHKSARVAAVRMASQNLSNNNKPPSQQQGAVVDAEGGEDKQLVFEAPPLPMREDYVQNAVKFLSHPKVRGSPVLYRHSFLEKKGLAKDKIDKAFRRVPDPQPSDTTTSPS